MKRLRDIEGGSPLLRKARALIEAVEPLPDSDARMHRIRRELDRPRSRMAGVLGLRRLPALVIAGIVAMFGASAFAAVRYFVIPAINVDRSEQAPAATAQARRSQRRPAAPRASAKVQAPLPAEALAPVADTTARSDISPSGSRVAAAPAKRGTPDRAERVARAEPEAPAAEAEASQPEPSEHVRGDSALVHRAVQALRRDHDPALAARLLEEHRSRYPSGPLAEEALSLQVEAALALHDTRAHALANEYLARYPNGRYSRVVARAISGASP